MSKTPIERAATRTKGMVLGLGAFEKISAVEGVRLSPEMKQDLQALDNRRMTAEQRTISIAGKYGKQPV